MERPEAGSFAPGPEDVEVDLSPGRGGRSSSPSARHMGNIRFQSTYSQSRHSKSIASGVHVFAIDPLHSE